MLDIMSSAMPCLDLHVCMHILCSYAFTCLYAWICVLPCFYAYIHMPICISPCLYVQISVFTCFDQFVLHALCHLSCALRLVYVLRPRPCLSCHVLLQTFCSFYCIFLCFGLMVQPDLDLWSLSSSMYHGPYQKGLDHSYLHVYACLLLCFTLVLASLVLGFVMFGALHELDLVWLHLTPMRPCSDVTIQEASLDAGLLHEYPSLFHSARCYAYHACLCHRWLSMHLYMLAYMFMHESCLLVCRPYFNTMKSWTSNPNLHLSPRGHHLLFDFFLVCLFACFLVCLPSSSLAYLIACYVSCHMLCLLRLYACLLYTHCALSTQLFLSIACLQVSCLCLCMYTYEARTHGARAWSPRHKQKGCRCKHVNMSQAAMFRRFRVLASPILLCILLNPLPSSFLPLRWVVLGIL